MRKLQPAATQSDVIIICRQPASPKAFFQSDIGKHKTDALLWELVLSARVQRLDMSWAKMTEIIQNAAENWIIKCTGAQYAILKKM